MFFTSKRGSLGACRQGVGLVDWCPVKTLPLPNELSLSIVVVVAVAVCSHSSSHSSGQYRSDRADRAGKQTEQAEQTEQATWLDNNILNRIYPNNIQIQLFCPQSHSGNVYCHAPWLMPHPRTYKTFSSPSLLPFSLSLPPHFLSLSLLDVLEFRDFQFIFICYLSRSGLDCLESTLESRFLSTLTGFSPKKSLSPG